LTKTPIGEEGGAVKKGGGGKEMNYGGAKGEKVGGKQSIEKENQKSNPLQEK